MHFETISWDGNAVKLIDQTKLPGQLIYHRYERVEDLWQGIRDMVIRGAPAIGIAAAMGTYLGVQHSKASTGEELRSEVYRVTAYLAKVRPTAVNLFWSLKRMEQAADRLSGKSVSEMKKALLEEAENIRRDDEERCHRIGEAGEPFIKSEDGVLTHCNAGGLATSGYGTALAVMFKAQERGRKFHVFVDETRPLLQGARLTAWELKQAGIPAKVICDNMAGSLMQKGRIQMVVVGADRIAANGDTANKIGTYSVAVLARHHSIPFYVAAPLSTFDLSLPDGSHIPIEERSKEEVLKPFGRALAPEGADAENPAFDVTPHALVTAFFTERGVIYPPYGENFKKLFG